MRKRMLLHAIPLLVGFVFFIPLMLKSFFPDLISFSLVNYNKWFGLIFSEATGLLFIVYSQAIFRSFYTFYGANKSLIACLLDFTHQHLTLLKMLSVMMNVYALILIGGGFIAFYANNVVLMIMIMVMICSALLTSLHTALLTDLFCASLRKRSKASRWQ